MRPSYDAHTYEQFVADQKRKGLERGHWKDLPKMWEEELEFRRELESALGLTPPQKAEKE